jgi:hypothetical protein
MKALSSMRKDSSTAFFTHSLTTQSPSRFSATRSVPLIETLDDVLHGVA